LPSTIGGDVVRGYSMSKTVDEDVEAFSSIFMDRFTGLVALVVFAVLGFALNPGLFSWRLSLPVVGLGLGTLGLLFFSFSGPGVRQIRPLLSVFPFDIDAKLQKLQESIRTYRAKNRYVSFALVLALCFQLISITTRFILAGALGLEIPFVFLLVMVPVTEVILFLPVSIQGFGAREALYIFFLLELGIDPAQAVALSVLVHILTLASASPGALGLTRS
jgi:uncharacterized membrane protein YbhN (UPF0104 family)